MPELVHQCVAPSWTGGTLERWLRRELGFSTSLLRKLKAQQGLFINDTLARTVDPLHPGDWVKVLLASAPAPHVTPEPIPLEIVYEDRDVVVLDKPAGLVVHPTHGVYTGTLANGLAWHWRARGEVVGIHPVHRLDRDTSGLVVFAKHPWAHRMLDKQLQERTLKRTYLAWVVGRPAQDAGVIDAPIALAGNHPVARAVAPGGQRAVTHWRCIRRFHDAQSGDAACLEVLLETGRTHQIRVHLAHLGHSIWGDRLYGHVATSGLTRQALHAATLGFFHPRASKWLEFSSPWPADIVALVSTLNPVESGLG